MKLSVALFFAGLFGALAAVLILLSFGTDYWLLALETCQPDSSDKELEDVQLNNKKMVSYHEGFFWLCYSGGNEDHLAWAHGFANRPDLQTCMPAYLYPYPQVTTNETDSTAYKPANIYRGFWSIFMLISVATVALGGFLIICAAPFASGCLYKAGGGLFLISGFFLLCCVVMCVLWFQLSDVMDVYVKNRSSQCQSFQVNLSYGLSFMLAPIGIFFSLMAGLLFLLIGRTVKNYN